jgi:hypothetical protein
MFDRDAFMGFTVTFDAILQFHAQWRQELRDGKDSSRLQVCSSWPSKLNCCPSVRGRSPPLSSANSVSFQRRSEFSRVYRDHLGVAYHGTVTAASDWGGPAERKRVRPTLPDSYEALFHSLQRPRFLLSWREGDSVLTDLRSSRLERAIGVVYRPETERQSHYFKARLPDQFDAILHFDETRAVEPLESTAEWDAGEVPETFPFAV